MARGRDILAGARRLAAPGPKARLFPERGADYFELAEQPAPWAVDEEAAEALRQLGYLE